MPVCAAKSQKFQELRSDLHAAQWGFPPPHLQVFTHLPNIKLSPRHRAWAVLPTSPSPSSLPSPSHTSSSSLGSFAAWFTVCPPCASACPAWAVLPMAAGQCWGHRNALGWLCSWSLSACIISSCLLLQSVLREPHTSSSLPAASHSQLLFTTATHSQTCSPPVKSECWAKLSHGLD